MRMIVFVWTVNALGVAATLAALVTDNLPSAVGRAVLTLLGAGIGAWLLENDK